MRYCVNIFSACKNTKYYRNGASKPALNQNIFVLPALKALNTTELKIFSEKFK